MGLFTIDRTTNFEEEKIKKILNILIDTSDIDEIEKQFNIQKISKSKPPFFKRRWYTFLNEFELYNNYNVTELATLFCENKLKTSELIIIILVRRTVRINNVLIRPFEVILKTLYKLDDRGIEAFISNKEFENILANYPSEHYEDIDKLVDQIIKRRNDDPTYNDYYNGSSCHIDIWKNLFTNAGLSLNNKGIELDLNLPILRFILKFFNNTLPSDEYSGVFEDEFIKYIEFPTLIDTISCIKDNRIKFKELYPAIIYSYFFKSSINVIEREILNRNENGKIPQQILNGFNISTNLNDNKRNLRLYEAFTGYEGIIINKLEKSGINIYEFISENISNYLSSDNKKFKNDQYIELINDDEFICNEHYDRYNSDDFLDEVFIEKDMYETIVSVLGKKQNIILEGSPGVGKTFMAKRLAFSLLGEKDISKVKLIQFHQSYSYEDFIEGYKPTQSGFELSKGIFYEFCKKAKYDANNNYYLIIDEINRGNLSKIFGELLMLIESDKREEKLCLAYSNEEFMVPKNLYIIGLMNTADRSLALIDYALRRRFSFIRIEPAFNNVRFIKTFNEKFDNDFSMVIDMIKKLNEEITNDKTLGSGFKIGHSYFCPNFIDEKGTKKDLRDIINFEIIPLLEEYWFDDEDLFIQWKNNLYGALDD